MSSVLQPDGGGDVEEQKAPPGNTDASVVPLRILSGAGAVLLLVCFALCSSVFSASVTAPLLLLPATAALCTCLSTFCKLQDTHLLHIESCFVFAFLLYSIGLDVAASGRTSLVYVSQNLFFYAIIRKKGKWQKGVMYILVCAHMAAQGLMVDLVPTVLLSGEVDAHGRMVLRVCACVTRLGMFHILLGVVGYIVRARLDSVGATNAKLKEAFALISRGLPDTADHFESIVAPLTPGTHNDEMTRFSNETRTHRTKSVTSGMLLLRTVINTDASSSVSPTSTRESNLRSRSGSLWQQDISSVTTKPAKFPRLSLEVEKDNKDKERKSISCGKRPSIEKELLLLTNAMFSKQGSLVVINLGNPECKEYTRLNMSSMSHVVVELYYRIVEQKGIVAEVRGDVVMAAWNAATAVDTGHAHRAMAFAGSQVPFPTVVTSGDVVCATINTTVLRTTVLVGEVVETAYQLTHLCRKIGCNLLVTQNTKDVLRPGEWNMCMIDCVRFLDCGTSLYVYTVVNTKEEADVFNEAFASFCEGKFAMCLRQLSHYPEPDVNSQVARLKTFSEANAKKEGTFFDGNFYCRTYRGWDQHEKSFGHSVTIKTLDSSMLLGGSGSEVFPAPQPLSTEKLQSDIRDAMRQDVSTSSQSVLSSDELLDEEVSSATCGARVCLPDKITDAMTGETVTRSSKMLGKGACGAVWLGVSARGQLTAVKFLRLPKGVVEKELQLECLTESGNMTSSKRMLCDIGKDPQSSVDALIQELLLLSRLTHPNIVAYKGYAMAGKHIALCMECVSGGSLQSLVDNLGKLPRPSLTRYTTEILEGLAYLHQNEVAHRDLKPSNILLQNDGSCQLTDFGTAVQLSKRSCGDQSTEMCGTPPYMSPDAARGEMESSCESDVWAMGVTVFQMASARLPYTDDQLGQPLFMFLRNVMNETVLPDISNLPQDRMKEFISTCLQLDYKKRPTCVDLLRHRWLLLGG